MHARKEKRHGALVTHLQATSELIGLFYIYGFGLTAMAALMALLFKRAKAAREELKLNPLEIVRTNQEIVTWFTMSFTGLVSGLFAIIMPVKIAVWAGFVYLTLPITIPYLATRYEKKAQSMQ